MCGHLDSFHFLALMSNAAMGICVQVFLWTYIFLPLSWIPRSGNAESYGMVCLIFKKLTTCFSKCLDQFPPETYKWSSLSKSSPTFGIVCLWFSHSSWCMVVSHCGFKFYSWLNNDVDYHFFDYSAFFFGKISIELFCQLLNWFVYFLLSCKSSLSILHTGPLSDIWFTNNFLIVSDLVSFSYCLVEKFLAFSPICQLFNSVFCDFGVKVLLSGTITVVV